MEEKAEFAVGLVRNIDRELISPTFFTVTVTTVTRLLTPTEDGVQGEQLEQGEARRPIRQKKPNPRFEGPKWVRR